MATEGFTDTVGSGDEAGDQHSVYEADRQDRAMVDAPDFEQSTGAVKYSAEASTNFVVDIENIAANLQANNDVSLSAVTVASLNSNEAESKFVTKQAVGGSTIKKQLEAAKKFQQNM